VDEGFSRYGIGEADFERANIEECQYHHNIHQEVDEHLGLREPGEAAAIRRDEIVSAASMLFVEVLQFSWVDPRGKLRRPAEASRRFAVASMLVQPALFGEGKLGYQEMGSLLRVTKQALSKIAREFQNCVGVRFRRSRRESSIDHMRGAMLASHRRRRLKRDAH